MEEGISALEGRIQSAQIAATVRAEGSLATGERLRPVVLGVLTVVLIGLCVVLALPFLPALAWGLALAIIAWPLHSRISHALDKPRLAAAVSTTAVALAVLASGVFVAYQLAREAGATADQVSDQSSDNLVRDKLAEAPGLGRFVERLDRLGIDIDQQVRKIIAPYVQDAAAIVNGSITGVVQSAVAIFILYHLLKDRSSLLQQVRGFLPLTRDECERVFGRVADSVHANLYATIITSIVDGVGGGLLFWALGLPSPVLWGIIMFFLSILPLLGTWLIWVPAGFSLALSGRWPEALLLLGWGIASWFVVDNIIYVRIAGDRMRLHQVPALIGFLGGLAVFGPSGMIIGPAVLAVTVALLEVWHQRASANGANDRSDLARARSPVSTNHSSNLQSRTA